MPSFVRSFSLLLGLLLWSGQDFADDFAAKIRYAKLDETADAYIVNVDIDYNLSPVAKEALHKGVPLTWDILIDVSQKEYLVDTLIVQKKVPYTLQFHALLNQYEVKNPGQTEMFLSLNAALNFMASLHDTVKFDKKMLQSGYPYLLAVKARFNREYLPVPLRPFAYLDTQWFLSSDWLVWQIQK